MKKGAAQAARLVRAGDRDRDRHPTPFNAAVVVKKTLRFKANAAVNVNVTSVGVLDMLCMADTATTAQRLFSSVRLDSVEVWSPMASDLVPVTCSVEFQAPSATSIGSPNFLHSDTSMGSDHCAHLRTSPSPSSIASMWQSRTATNTLFTLVCPANSIVDVHLTLCLQNGEPATAVTGAPVGATVGTVYCRGLDGAAAASTVLPPVSYATV